jgi:uncharacterized membrane protein YobD (UPF0266 family)
MPGIVLGVTRYDAKIFICLIIILPKRIFLGLAEITIILRHDLVLITFYNLFWRMFFKNLKN